MLLIALGKLDGTPLELDAFIATFAAGSVSPGKRPGGVSGSQGDRSMGLGNAPPCSAYKDLTIWASLEEHALAINDCVSKAEIEECKKKVTSFVSPFSDLLQSISAVIGDINRVKTAKAKAAHTAGGAAAGAAARKSGAGADAAAVATQLDMLLGELRSLCTDVKSMRWDDSKANFDQWLPSVISLGDKAKDMFEHSDVAQMLKDFGVKFGDACGHIFRADAPCTDASETVVETFIPEIFPDIVTSKIGCDKFSNADQLKPNLQISAFGIAKGHTSTATEKWFWPCIRLSFKGTRTGELRLWCRSVRNFRPVQIMERTFWGCHFDLNS